MRQRGRSGSRPCATVGGAHRSRAETPCRVGADIPLAPSVREAKMTFLRWMLVCSPPAIMLLSSAASQAAEGISSPATLPSGGYVLFAQAQPGPPLWSFVRFLPPDKVLPRDKQRAPAVLGFLFGMNPPADWIVTWTNDVRAAGQRLTQEVVQAQGSRHLFFKIDPCQVAGLDTPGTEIPVTYEFVFSASQPHRSWIPPPAKESVILRLDQDKVKPFISSLRAPATVHRDETVQVAISATDVSDEMGGELAWDSGLHVFSLEGPSNPGDSGLQTYPVDDSMPQTCNEKVKRAEHSFSYTVPHSAQPGDVITLRAQVQDWSRNATDREVVLKVIDERQDAGGTQDAGGRQQNRCNRSNIVRGLDFSFPCP